MKSLQVIMVIICIITTLQSCLWMTEEGEYQKIVIQNNSWETTYMYIKPGSMKDTIFVIDDIYPVRNTFEEDSHWVLAPFTQVTSNSDILSLIEGQVTHWAFIFFSKETFEKYTNEEIVEKQMKLSAKAYTLRQLDSLNWTITYP